MMGVRAHLRALAEALPVGAAVPVPREWLLELLDACRDGAGPPATAGPPTTPPALLAAPQPIAKAEDRLLKVDAAAKLLNVAPRWLYRHAATLPFARHLGRKTLRFSEAGLRRWAERR